MDFESMREWLARKLATNDDSDVAAAPEKNLEEEWHTES